MIPRRTQVNPPGIAKEKTMKVEGGALTDAFKPLEVHVYVMK